MNQYPRVLIIVMPKVQADDAANLLIRMQFGNWPKQRLAQIFSSEPKGTGEFCGSYYQLQAVDRFWGRLFYRLRSEVSAIVAMAPVEQAHRRIGLLSQIKHSLNGIKKKIGDMLIASGIWEIVFHVRLSTPLIKFVQEFHPDIIYCSGYSLGFTTLPLLVSKKFNIPICFQTTEDWPLYTYSLYSPIGICLRKRAAQLIQRASIRLAFGEKMKHIYELRYKCSFYATYHLDDARRCNFSEKLENRDVKRIVFTGSLVLNRFQNFEDLYKAVKLLLHDGIKIEILVYCTGIPQELSTEVRDSSIVKFLPLPSHNETPNILRSADILFLPEAFTISKDRLGMAISTKCHLYMMVNRPILVYGPDYSGTVEYALAQGWALVVSRRNTEALADGVRQLLSDNIRRIQFIQSASKCFKINHNILIKQKQFEKLFNSISYHS